MDLDLWVTFPDGSFEPLPGGFVPVAEKNDPRIYLPHKIEQIVAIGMRGQVEIISFAATGYFACADAEEESFIELRFL